jgi:hypothetical protein
MAIKRGLPEAERPEGSPGWHLQQVRHALDLTTVELGRTLGVGGRAVQRWEAGEREIPSHLWLALRTLLETQILRERRHHASSPSPAALVIEQLPYGMEASGFLAGWWPNRPGMTPPHNGQRGPGS